MVFLRLTSLGAFAKMNLQRFKIRRKRGGMKSMFQVVKRDGEVDNFRIDKITKASKKHTMQPINNSVTICWTCWHFV